MPKLITGYSGERSITPKDDALLYYGFTGENCSMQEIDLEAINANEIIIKPCEFVLDGRYVRVESNEKIILENGTVGQNRTDYIYIKLTEPPNNPCTADFFISKGKDLGDSTGNLNTSSTAMYKIGRVYLRGINISTIKTILPVYMSTEWLNKRLKSGTAINGIDFTITQAEYNYLMQMLEG